LQALFDQAAGLKSDPVRPLLQGRTLALLFLNRSLRTRASFQIGAAQLGAKAIVLEPVRQRSPAVRVDHVRALVAVADLVSYRKAAAAPRRVLLRHLRRLRNTEFETDLWEERQLKGVANK
jgi:ornithine carbamoyltransferase